MRQTDVASNNYDMVDLAKYVCAILIIVLHTNPFEKCEHYIIPFTHIAVPFFFVASSFFLEKKMLLAGSYEEKKHVLRNYILGLMKLYFVTLVLTFPATAITRDFKFSKGIVYGVIYTLREFIFHSTWRSSWYIMATVIGTLITFIVLEKFNVKFRYWVIPCLILYFICVIGSVYSELIYVSDVLGKIYSFYIKLFTVPYTSFPVSFIWILAGIIFAKYEERIRKFSTTNIVLVIFFSSCTLVIESMFANLYGLTKYSSDCYFSLLPLVLGIFAVLIRMNCKIRSHYILRKSSTYIYCVQGSIVELCNLYHWGGVYECLIVFIFSNLISIVILTIGYYNRKEKLI